MAKTRSQTRNMTIKKEEEEEDHKPSLLLNGVSTTRGNNKITKRKPSKSNDMISSAQQIKVEEDTDTKSLLKPASKCSKIQKVSQEQIKQLIDYVANHSMSISEASRKVKISRSSGFNYYNVYKNDPEKKIPAPRIREMQNERVFTQEDVVNLIKYIVDDKMTVKGASDKTNMTHNRGRYYYNKYLNDPNHNIPIRRVCAKYTQKQTNELIRYIVNDKMSISAASRKAKMSAGAGHRYYVKYIHDQNPAPSHIATYTRCTQEQRQEQRQELISYIVNDKMSIAAASRKVNMCHVSASKHYHQYLKDNNMEIPVSRRNRRYKQDEINQFISYIADDKMSIRTASKKANMNYSTGKKHYRQYVKENNIRPSSSRYTQDQINKFIGYIVDDGMDMKTASKKANIHHASGDVYYRKYRKEHNLDLPAITYRQDKIKEITGYIIDNKMSVWAASKKADVHYKTGKKYYRRYLNDEKRGVRT